MMVELMEEEKTIVRHTLELYLSNLRDEITYTDNRSWKEAMLREIISRMN